MGPLFLYKLSSTYLKCSITVPEQCYEEPNYDYLNNDLGVHGPSSDANGCRVYCTSISGATHFSKDNIRCMCKTSASGRTDAAPSDGYWSGNVLCGGELKVFGSFDFSLKAP